MAKARPIKGIDCKAPALDGIRLVLTERFAEMCELNKAALDWEDPEGVHSMRVASRRLRSALRDFMPYLKNRELNPTVKQIRSLADALGEVRDRDVAILALEELSSHTPTEVSSALQQIIDNRKALLEPVRTELQSSLVKADLKRLELDFRSAVIAATTRKLAPDSTVSDPSYLEVARAVIIDRLSEVEKLSESLYNPFESEPLHEMRIAVKRLRYAIELFQECWGKHLLRFAKFVTRLQNSLGNIHDCDVWIESFGKLIADSKKSNEGSHDEAFAWLFTHFVKMRNRHFLDAFKQWREWEAKELSNKLREALKS